MPSEQASLDERASARALVGRSLAALVAAQANWAGINQLPRDERQTIESWAAKARVDLNRLTAKARSRLLDVANNALMSVALGSTSPKVDDKLGDLGLLSPRAYEVEITERLRSDLADHALSKGEIVETVHNPDAHQHLSPPMDFQLNAELISLFVRVLNRTKITQESAPPVWSFVLGNRKGRKVIVRDAYRIQAAKLVVQGETPLDLFKAFCELYGCELTLNQKPIGKFLVYARVMGTGTVQAHRPPNHKVQLSIITQNNVDGSIEFAVGYAIDLTEYRSSLSPPGSA
jgi:hypothetical protein